MSNYLGFEPCKGIDYFFVSYNNEDADRVGVIAEKLNSRGVPLWYDFGIPYGDLWEKTISKKIKGSKAVILFFTKDILFKEQSYVRKEYKIATEYFDKKVYVVMMDTINSKYVPEDKVFWWIDIKDRQNIDVAGIDNPDDVIRRIADALGISVAELAQEHVMREYIEAGGAKKATDLLHTGELIDTSTGRMILDNRYELKRIIGEGGFGITYVAEDLRNENVVAVKFGGFPAKYIIRMHQHLIGKSNDNLCEIYDAAITFKGESYIAMEWLSKYKSLSSVKDYWELYENLSDDYPLGIHIFVLTDVLNGLKCLHENGIVHDDINPSNILTNGFTTKIIDFSGAFFLKDKENPDGEHTRLLYEYHSPEKSGERDFRSDLYAVGLVAYRWLTGCDPAKDRQGNLVFENVKLDRKAKAIIKKATEINPANRYQTADEFICALNEYHDWYCENYRNLYDVDECYEDEYFEYGIKELKYSDCKDLVKRINISSDSVVIPEEFGVISEHALEGLWVEKIYIPKTICQINKNSLRNLGYKTKAIYLHKDNPVYYIDYKALTNKITGESIPVKNGIALRYYSK